MRLRILDWNSRWFWLVFFYRKDFSGSTDRHMEIHLYGPQMWGGTWLNFWIWEPLPDMRPQVATLEPHIVLDATKMCWPGNEPLA